MCSLVGTAGFCLLILSGKTLPPVTTWLPSDNQGLHTCKCVCVFLALIQVCLFCAPQEDPGRWLLGLHVETPQPKLQHEQPAEQLPAGTVGKAAECLAAGSARAHCCPSRLRVAFLDTCGSSQSHINPQLCPVFPRVQVFITGKNSLGL